MNALAWLIPCALALGGLGLAAFMWALRSGQFEDLDGAAWRAIMDDGEIGPGSGASSGQEGVPGGGHEDRAGGRRHD